MTLDGDKTVGSMSIDDTTSTFFAYTFNAGTPTTSKLIFDVASGSAQLSSPTATNAQTVTINPSITLNDPLVITTTRTNVTGGITLAGVISDGLGSYGITKNGSGSLTMNGANEYDGGTTISAGRVQIGSATAFGSGSVSIASGGQAFFATGTTVANNFSIAGNGYTNTADQGALNGALRYQGTTTTGTITLTGSARIGAFGAATTGTLAGSLTGGAFDLEINASSNASFNGNIVLTGSAAGLTGTVTVTQGTLRLGTNSNLGGSLIVRDNANLYGDSIGVPGAATIAGNLTLGNTGSTTTGANFFADPNSVDAFHVNGNVVANGLTSVNFSGPLVSNSVVLMTYTGSFTGSASNFTLPGGLASYRPGTAFTVGGGQVKLDIVLGSVTWTGATSNLWNLTDSNWLDGSSATAFYNTDTVTFDESQIRAFFTTNLTNATNNDLSFFAKTVGLAGEDLSVEYVDPGAANAALGINLTGSAIVVSLATDASGAIVSTANQVKSAIEANAATNALVSISLVASNDGSGVVAPMFSGPFLLPDQAISIASTVSPADFLFQNEQIKFSLTGAGSIGGSGLLTKTGAGDLTISTANTFSGGVMLSEGKIRLGNATALGTGLVTMTTGTKLSSDSVTARSLSNAFDLSGALTLSDSTDTGALTLNGAVTLSADTSIEITNAPTNAHSIAGVISDGASSFKLTKKGSDSSLTLASANQYDGGTVIEGGRIQASNNASFGTGLVTVQSGGSAYLTGTSYANAFKIEGIGFIEASGNLGAIRLQGSSITGPIALNFDARITAHGSTGSLLGNITQTLEPCALELSNYSTTTDSTITVAGNNSYSYGTTIKGAIVIANHNNALGTGPVLLQSNGTVARVTRLQLGTDIAINNDIVLDSNASTGVSAITSYAGDNTTASVATVNGDIEILQAVGGGGHLASNKTSNSVLRVMGEITSPNGVSVLVRQGTVELGGGGSYSAIQIVDGTVKNAANNGLSTSAVLSIGTSGTAGDNGTYNLNGFSQTLAGLIKGAQPATVLNNGASASTLTLQMPSSGTYAGTFGAGSSDLHLIKSGVGTLTLSASSATAIGSLTVSQGGLNLTGSLGASTFSSTMNAGSVLSGEGTFGGDLTLNGATVQVNGATSLGVFAAGNVTTTGGVNVELTTLPADSNPIEVIAFGGTITGSAANFSLLSSANYRNPQFQVNTNNVTLTLGAAANLSWTGSVNNIWDINTSANWLDASLASSNFLFGDNVIFGNTGAGTIQVPATVNPSLLDINSSDNYIFQGLGTLQPASLAKSGTGKATIETPWAIAGPISLTAGALEFSPAVSITGTLPTTISGAGTLIKNGDGILSVSAANTSYTGTVEIAKGELIAANTSAFGSAAKIQFGNASTLAANTSTLTLNSGVALASPIITIANTCLNARIQSASGTANNATITQKSTGTLTIGHPTNYDTATAYITGTSSIVVEKGNLAFSSRLAIASNTAITLGNASSDHDNTVLEIPLASAADQSVLIPAITLGTLDPGDTSQAIVRYVGAGTSGGAPAMTGTLNLNGRDIYLENYSQTIAGVSTERLYNFGTKISGTGNVHVRCGTLPDGNFNGGRRCRILNTTNDWVGQLYIDTGMLQIYSGAGGAFNCIPNTCDMIMAAGTRVGMGCSDTIDALVGSPANTETGLKAPEIQANLSSTTTTVTLTVGADNGSGVYHGSLISGGGILALTKTGTGTQTLNGASTYTGATAITGGTLAIGNDSALGTGTVNLNVATGTIRSSDTSTRTISNAITYSTNFTLGSSTTGNLIFSGPVNLGAGDKEWNVQNASTEFSGVISGTATPTRTKTGPGTLVFSGANTYTGTTIVSQGTLALVGGSQTSAIVVNTGASLGFTVGSPTSSTSTFNLTNGKVKISGTPTLESYTLISASAGITGTPVLETPVNGYELKVVGNTLILKQAGYAAWAAIHAIDSNPDADKDGDGVSNAVEYVLGGDKDTNDASKLPTVATINGNIVFSFKRKRSSIDGVTTSAIDIGTSLDSWPNSYTVGTTSNGPITIVEDSPTGFDTITLTLPQAPDPKKFGRLKVTVAP